MFHWQVIDPDYLAARAEQRCEFGITEAIGGLLATGLGSLGVGATTAGILGTAGAGVLEGAAGGAGISALTGGKPGVGALTGGLTGGAIAGLGPLVGSATGLGTTAGDVLAGAGAGAAGSALTGSSPLLGAAEGAGGGLVAGLTGPAAAPGTTTTGGTGSSLTLPGLGSATGGGTSVLGAAAPAGVGGVSPDLTSGAITPGGDLGGILNDLGGGTVNATNLGASGGTVLPGAASGGSDLTTTGLGGSPTAAGATLAGGASSGGSGSGLGSILSDLGQGNLSGAASGLESSIGNGLNNMSWGTALRGLTAGGGLLYNLAQGNGLKNIPGYSELSSEASQLGTQGQQLQSFLQNGTLPAGVQASLDQATNSAVQAVKAKYAQLGESGSSMEQQEIATLQENAAAQGGQLALNLLQQGVQMSGLSAQLYQSLLSTNQAQNQQTIATIGNLVSALGGGTKLPGGTLTFNTG